ncbi:MAG: peptidoglycan DD-metalloendopeptidase family protein [Gammaproteobacteria bacterium]|nr:peptidoglycan DD-metalloendopeptidase family protein [Gammaproteobacteria bacterium]
MHYSFISIAVCLLLLTACGGQSVKAPIDSRNNNDSATKSRAARTPAVKTSSASFYVVARGDTLHSIAWQHGLGYRELASINGIRPPYTIYSGQRLRVRPAAGSSGARTVPLQQRKAVVSSRPVTASASKSVPKSVPKAAARSVSSPPPVPQATVLPVFNGVWVWPTRGRVLSKFQSNSTGKRGIEIGGHADQPVKAAANGTVVYAGSGLVGYGRLIIIRHNENLLSAYGHNSTLLVAEGEHVKAGKMIAKMGSSGTSRDELYFEIRKDGKPVDPLKYLPRK